jgi:hypothetical protein
MNTREHEIESLAIALRAAGIDMDTANRAIYTYIKRLGLKHCERLIGRAHCAMRDYDKAHGISA